MVVLIHEPSQDSGGNPISDLFNTVAFITKTGQGLVRIREFPATSPSGGGVHELRLDFLKGELTVQAVSYDSQGMHIGPGTTTVETGTGAPGSPVLEKGGLV